MCNVHGNLAMTIPDDGLNDDLSSFFGDFGLEAPKPGAPLKLVQPVEDLLHYEPCKACRGSGKFRSYTGRVVGDCFKCKGAGKLGFKTTTEHRAKARQQKADRKQATIEAWGASNPDEWAWLQAATDRGFRIAGEFMEALSKFGSLTEGKMNLIRRFINEDAERAAAKEASIREAKVIDLSKIMEAFENAAANSIKAPMLRFDQYRFAYKPEKGVIYVRTSDREVEAYYGRIEGGKFFRSRECTPEHEERILAAAADPHAAAIAYGRREGACSVCGRGLTNHESIDLGIGPICAGRMGW